MSDDTFNGWKNYPTWCVNLWLSSDEMLYLEGLDIARDVATWRHPTSEYWTEEQSVRFNTADVFKDWVTNVLTPDLGASFPADLLGYALGQVDWHEIADAWIEQVEEDA